MLFRKRRSVFDNLKKYATKPVLYAPSTSAFWDDEHISKGMLQAHLNPNWEAASRKHDFIDKSVNWIAGVAPPTEFKFLLDLGCGPGLYSERFSSAGFLRSKLYPIRLAERAASPLHLAQDDRGAPG